MLYSLERIKYLLARVDRSGCLLLQNLGVHRLCNCASGEEDAHQKYHISPYIILILLSKKRKKKVTSGEVAHKCIHCQHQKCVPKQRPSSIQALFSSEKF